MNDKNLTRTAAILALGIATMFVPTGAAAAQNIPSQSEMMSRADTNGDGNIEWSEVTALRAKTFDRLDRNGDGVISKADQPARAGAAQFKAALAKVQADFDADGDREVTKDEMMNAPAPLFDAGDTNGDGVLTAEEMAALRASSPRQ